MNFQKDERKRGEKKMKKVFKYSFYPNGELAEIKVIAESDTEAEKLIRQMIDSRYFDDGLFLNDKYDYVG